MSSSKIVSQIDFNRYTPDAAASNQGQPGAPQDANNRPTYLDQLKKTFQQNNNSTEKTARKKTISSKKTSLQSEQQAPSKTRRQTTPSNQSEQTAASSTRTNNQQNNKSTGTDQAQVAQSNPITPENKAEQASIENQNLSDIENKVELETLIPPVHIDELFQQQEPGVEEKELSDIPVNSNDTNLPPSGLVAELVSFDSENLINPQDETTELKTASETIPTELVTNIASNNPTLTITKPTDTIENNGQEPNTNQSNVNPLEITASTKQTLVNDISLKETVSEEDLASQETTTKPSTSLVIETGVQQEVAPVILPFQKQNDTTSEETLQETTSPENKNSEHLPIKNVQQQKQLAPQINVTEPPVTLKTENDFSSNQSTVQQSTLVTSVSKKTTASEKPTDQLTTPVNVPTSPTFSEGLSNQISTNVAKGNSITAQEESILNQTADAVQSSIEQGESLSIRLTPPELGMIQININREDGVISARLEVQTPEAHSTIMQHLQTLQDSLQQNGKQVQNISIHIAPQTAEDQTPGDTNHSEEQQSYKEQDEQHQEKKQETKEEQSTEQTDGDQLNIAA